MRCIFAGRFRLGFRRGAARVGGLALFGALLTRWRRRLMHPGFRGPESIRFDGRKN